MYLGRNCYFIFALFELIKNNTPPENIIQFF